MPRNVRNFWIELTIDGAAKRIETRSKDGGFTLTILQRDKGGIIGALDIVGIAQRDGGLRLVASSDCGRATCTVALTPGENHEIEIETRR